MKAFAVISTLALTSFCFSAAASVSDSLAVYATQKSTGSMSVGGKSAYTNTFDVALANLSDKDVDLSKVCLKATAPDHKEFKLDTVDEALVKGQLKAGKMAKGIAVFASEDAGVYKAGLITLSDDCK
ncbi:DUF4354 family protein [Enterobacter sp. Cy-643]|uniref:DUF4354 family protein n=1 Tax=Enterobacter sp. Cy-643 TaxID=2608346 RepID=UPI00141DC099|nr:DUF4354 family protein [Enterobacter sp. Cy-643]NIF32830.1 DUF4354 family protein [Enterobacter sp. Cy-643]